MPVAEPASEFWPDVKALSGWPVTNEDRIRELAAQWRRQGNEFAEVARIPLDDLERVWPDDAGTAYRTRVGEHLRTAARTGSDMVELGRRAEVFAGEVAAVKTAINNLMARNAPLFVDVLPIVRTRYVQDLAAMVNRLMEEGAARISGGAGQPLGRAELPPAGSDPASVLTWWQTRPTAAQEKLITENPDAIRNLDGIPADVRDRANRAAIDREIAAVNAQLAELNANPPPHAVAHVEQARVLKDKIASLEDLRRLDANHFILGLDARGDGRAIVSIGNPDTARNVATLVPGIFNELDDVSGVIDRAATLRTGADTASIAWLGYDTPGNLAVALSDNTANDAKDELATFQQGLRATHVGDASHNTVVAHSYGTTVAGAAARDLGLAADDLVIAASTDPGVDHVGELRLLDASGQVVPPREVGQRVHATTAPDDVTALLGTLPGANNPVLPGFGARVFDTPSGADDAHRAPFDPGPALDEIRRIIAGDH